ncbi:MAG: hypothetical protein ACYC5Q_13670 [Thermoleophilia bacterium]
MTAPPPKHSWTFTRHFRAHAYGWKASRLAAKRLREAVTEIRAVARKDPGLGMEGAVVLLERFVGAVCGVDDSWGILGTGFSRELGRLEPVLSALGVDADTRLSLLRRVLAAWHADEYGYLAVLPDVFPRFVAGADEARILVVEFERRAEAHDRRSEEIQAQEAGWSYAATVERVARDAYRRMATELELGFLEPDRALELALVHDFHDGGVTLARTLLSRGRVDDARAVLEAGAASPHSAPDPRQMWFELLAEAGEDEAAYIAGAHWLAANVSLERFRKVCKGLPGVERPRLARDAMALTPESEKGRWFATLNTLALHEMAGEVARDHAVNPETALRAAVRYGATQPAPAFESYVAAARGFASWGEPKNDHYIAEVVVTPALSFATERGSRDEMVERLSDIEELRGYPIAWSRLTET